MATSTSEGSADPLADEIAAPVLVRGARGAFQRDELIEALAEAGEGREAALQAFAPEAVYGPEHLRAAARRAIRSHREGRAIARNLSVEVACYAACTDQIEDALAAVGVPAAGDRVVLCAVGERAREAAGEALAALDLEPDPDVLGRPEGALDRLGVSPELREATPEEDWPLLALEAVALLDARR